MYKTRIVNIGNNYFVDYKWAGGFWRGLLSHEALFWTRWSMVPDSSIEKARETAKRAIKSHELNYSWNTKVSGGDYD